MSTTDVFRHSIECRSIVFWQRSEPNTQWLCLKIEVYLFSQIWWDTRLIDPVCRHACSTICSLVTFFLLLSFSKCHIIHHLILIVFSKLRYSFDVPVSGLSDYGSVCALNSSLIAVCIQSFWEARRMKKKLTKKMTRSNVDCSLISILQCFCSAPKTVSQCLLVIQWEQRHPLLVGLSRFHTKM